MKGWDALHIIHRSAKFYITTEFQTRGVHCTRRCIAVKALRYLYVYQRSTSNEHQFLQRALHVYCATVLARGLRSSVCPSITFRCFVQMNEDTIVRFSASGRTLILVSGEVKFSRIFAGDHSQ